MRRGAFYIFLFIIPSYFLKIAHLPGTPVFERKALRKSLVVIVINARISVHRFSENSFLRLIIRRLIHHISVAISEPFIFSVMLPFLFIIKDIKANLPFKWKYNFSSCNGDIFIAF